MNNIFFRQYLKAAIFKYFDPRVVASDFCSTWKPKPPWKILFFGTDNFSLYSLDALHSEYCRKGILEKLEVVTTPKCPIAKFAKKHHLKVHEWPPSLKNNKFDIGLVVSFGHLIPEKIINVFPFGILNVHASLLPRWRGAAPIIYALANGDKETGVSIMSIKPNHFDVGDVLKQAKIPISESMKMPELYKKLGQLGAECLIESLKDLPEVLKQAKPQSEEGVTYAPKVKPSFAQINWKNMTSVQVYNLGRALDGYLVPMTRWKSIPVKLLEINLSNKNCDDVSKSMSPGFVWFDGEEKCLNIVCADKTCVSVRKIKVHGKKLMAAIDFNNGYIRKESLESRFFE